MTEIIEGKGNGGRGGNGVGRREKVGKEKRKRQDLSGERGAHYHHQRSLWPMAPTDHITSCSCLSTGHTLLYWQGVGLLSVNSKFILEKTWRSAYVEGARF